MKNSKPQKINQKNIKENSESQSFIEKNGLHVQIFILLIFLATISTVEGSDGWMVICSILVLLVVSLFLRELLWGNDFLINDLLVRWKTTNEKKSLFFFGKREENSEDGSVERKKLLKVSSTSKRIFLRVSLVVMSIIFYYFLKNQFNMGVKVIYGLYFIGLWVIASTAFITQFLLLVVLSTFLIMLSISKVNPGDPYLYLIYIVFMFFVFNIFNQLKFNAIQRNILTIKAKKNVSVNFQSILILTVSCFLIASVLNKIIPNKSQKISEKDISFTQKKVNQMKEAITNGITNVANQIQKNMGEDGVYNLSSTEVKGSDKNSKFSRSSNTGNEFDNNVKSKLNINSNDLQKIKNKLSVSNYDTLAKGLGSDKSDSTFQLDQRKFNNYSVAQRNNLRFENDLKQKLPLSKELIDKYLSGSPPQGEVKKFIEEKYKEQIGEIEGLDEDQKLKLVDLGKELDLTKDELVGFVKKGDLPNDKIGKFIATSDMEDLNGKSKDGEIVSPDDVEMIKTDKSKLSGNALDSSLTSKGVNHDDKGEKGDDKTAQMGQLENAEKTNGNQSVQKNSNENNPNSIVKGFNDSGEKNRSEYFHKNGKILTREERREKVKKSVETIINSTEKLLKILMYLIGFYIFYRLIFADGLFKKTLSKNAPILTKEERKKCLLMLENIYKSPTSIKSEVIQSYHVLLEAIKLANKERAPSQTPNNFSDKIGSNYPAIKNPFNCVTNDFCKVLYSLDSDKDIDIKNYRQNLFRTLTYFGVKLS